MFLLVADGVDGARLLNVGHSNFFWRVSCSTFIRARLIVSCSVFGLNMYISSEISSLNPPMKVPTNALRVHPCTRLPIFQIPSGILKASWFALLLIVPHQNLHILLVQSEPIVLLQMFPKSLVTLIPGMPCSTTATTGWLCLRDERMLIPLIDHQLFLGNQKIGVLD